MPMAAKPNAVKPAADSNRPACPAGRHGLPRRRHQIEGHQPGHERQRLTRRRRDRRAEAGHHQHRRHEHRAHGPMQPLALADRERHRPGHQAGPTRGDVRHKRWIHGVFPSFQCY